MIVATFGRGALIDATLTSLAQQSYRDFEVLVVSDGPAAPGLADVVRDHDARFTFHELPERTRSQSGPNNAGWRRARGRYIAYLGHDDIWHPEHLARLSAAFKAHPEASFAVGGCVMMMGPPDVNNSTTMVTGMFESASSEVAQDQFFPPSSVAHRRLLPDSVERWPDAAGIREPVDSRFMRRAAELGCIFASTRAVTVYKFNSATRYLSYLAPDDGEQRDMLDVIARPTALASFTEAQIRSAKDQGHFGTLRHPDPEDFEPGAILTKHERVRGIEPMPVAEVSGRVWISPGEDYRAFDWYEPEFDDTRPYRWSGPSRRPRLALPYFHPELVRVEVRILRFIAADVRTSLEVRVDGRRVDATLTEPAEGGDSVLGFMVQTRDDRATVVELRMNRSVAPHDLDAESLDMRPLGLCLLGIELTVADPHAPE